MDNQVRFKVKKPTIVVLLIMASLLSILFAVTSARFADVRLWFVPVIGLGIGISGLIEAGVVQYFTKSTYKTLTIREIAGLFAVFIFAAMIMSSLFMFPMLSAGVPTALAATVGTIGGLAGVIGAIFFIIYIFI